MRSNQTKRPRGLASDITASGHEEDDPILSVLPGQVRDSVTECGTERASRRNGDSCWRARRAGPFRLRAQLIRCVLRGDLAAAFGGGRQARPWRLSRPRPTSTGGRRYRSSHTEKRSQRRRNGEDSRSSESKDRWGSGPDPWSGPRGSDRATDASTHDLPVVFASAALSLPRRRALRGASLALFSVSPSLAPFLRVNFLRALCQLRAGRHNEGKDRRRPAPGRESYRPTAI